MKLPNTFKPDNLDEKTEELIAGAKKNGIDYIPTPITKDSEIVVKSKLAAENFGEVRDTN